MVVSDNDIVILLILIIFHTNKDPRLYKFKKNFI